MYSRQTLANAIGHHLTSYQEEHSFASRFIDLLKHPQSFRRDHLPGHITASGWIVNNERSKVLLVMHAKLNKWLQPGGHADGDEDVLSVARKEIEEETGLKKVKLLGAGFFDLDIHTIPARKDFPEHLHYDVRFAFAASEKDKLIISDESTQLEWVPLSELPARTKNSSSMMRMAEKIKVFK